MANFESVLYIVLLIVFIGTVPLTWLSKYAWKSRALFLIFSGIGLASFLILTLMIWVNY